MIEWRVIPDFPAYEISNDGLVRRVPIPGLRSKGRPWAIRKPLKVTITPYGYRSVGLWKNGRQLNCRVARLVLMAFMGPSPSDVHQAAHNDGSKTNDTVTNLRWATPTENQSDRHKHGTRYKLTAADESRIKEAVLFGAQQKGVATAWGVVLSTIWHVIRRAA